MFNLKFISKRGYKSYSAPAYEVDRSGDPAVVKIYKKISNTGSHREAVGDDEQYYECWVTNSEGRTVDSIKQRSKSNAA